MFSFVFMQQNGLTITIRGGHDATALFYRCTYFTDIDHAAESGKQIEAHTLSGCNPVMSWNTRTSIWEHSSNDHYFCFYTLCCREIYSGTASSASLKHVHGK